MSNEFPQVPTVMIPDDRYASAVETQYGIADLTPVPMRSVKLGRVKPKSRPQCLRLGSYLPAVATPPSVDYSPKAMPSIQRMYLNDTYGDCVIASLAHRLGIYSFNDPDSGGGILAADSEIQSMYNAWKAGPGDSGCIISDVLNNLKAIGALAGGKRYKIDGYVSVDWRNVEQVKAAIYIFGSLTIGVNLPSAWANSPNGGLWDVTNTQIVGGHDICAVGYDARGVQIATWGGMRTITWSAFTSTRWVDELYVELSPSWYGTDKVSASGIDVATLRADLDKIGGGGIPPIDPPSPPPPPPPIHTCPVGQHWDESLQMCVNDPPVPPVPPAPYVPPSFDVEMTGLFPQGLNRWVQVTMKGVAIPRTVGHDG